MASIVGKYKRLGTVENLARSCRLYKITLISKRKILGILDKKNPQTISKELQADFLDSGTNFTLRTASTTLHWN